MAWFSDSGFEMLEDSDINYQKTRINQLSSNLSQTVVYGIVIAKQDMRRVSSRKQPTSVRFVLNFTVRDSPNDVINVACWGEENVITTLSASFKIGDVVKMKNPQVLEKQSESTDERFKPPSTSPYHLNISPLYSEVTVCSGEERKSYEKLLHCPLHTASTVVNLADIINNSQSADGLIINLLVAIKEIRKLQTVKTKDGREVKKLQLSVFDKTYPVYPVLIWEEETANFILKHCSKRTVVFISDIKVSYNNFMREMIATSGSTTVFTPEPDIGDGRVLYQYAMKVILDDDTEDNLAEYSDPSIVYTAHQIINFMNSSELTQADIQGTLNAMISYFDIDGTSKITSFKCPGCLAQFEKSDEKCINGECEVGSGMTNLPAEEMYNIPLALADNTGSILRCHLSGTVAQSLLSLKVYEFLRLSEEDKTKLKWNYLFERVSVRFKIVQSSTGRAIFRIVACEKKDAK